MINEGKTWFSKPTQLKVEDPNNADIYIYGIGYHDVFICGCCGSMFELEEINEDGLEIIELDWVNFSDYIR